MLLVSTFMILQMGVAVADNGSSDTSKLQPENAISISEKYILLSQLADKYLLTNTDSAILIGNRALEIAHELNDNRLIVESVLRLSDAYQNSALYELGIALIYNTLEEPSIANNQGFKANLLLELGDLNTESVQYDEAISLILEAISIYRNLGLENKVARCQNRLAENYYRKHNYFVAISYADSSIQLSERYQIKPLLATNFEILGAIHNNLAEYDKALEYLNKSLEITKTLNKKPDITNILNNIALCYYDQGDYGNAATTGKVALDLARQIKSKTLIENAAHILAKSFAALGNYQTAYQYSEIAESLRREMFLENRDNQISTLNRIYEFEKQKREIASQKFELEAKEREIKRKQIQNILLIAWIVIMMILLVMVNRIYRKLRKTNELLANKNHLIEDQKRKIENQAESYKNAYTRLKELDQFKEAMTHMLVHDLKNPLNVLINIPELGDFEEKDDIIMHTGKQMMTLVMNMLDIQKFENNRMELNLVYIPVSKVLETASKDVSFSAKHKNITITHTFGDDFILYIDKELIIRTLVNLLNNSIKFSPSSSPVTINVMKESKDRVMIEVTDQGVGIDKANQDLIFEKFVHIKQNSSGTMRSTGLGLTFCKMAVEAHKCHIGVISEKDKGATFWFTLPLGLNK